MRDDDSYRWGDDPRDHRDLDAWLTREPEPFPGDLLDVSDLGGAAGLSGPAWVTAEAWEALHGEVEDALAAAARGARGALPLDGVQVRVEEGAEGLVLRLG